MGPDELILRRAGRPRGLRDVRQMNSGERGRTSLSRRSATRKNPGIGSRHGCDEAGTVNLFGGAVPNEEESASSLTLPWLHYSRSPA